MGYESRGDLDCLLEVGTMQVESSGRSGLVVAFDDEWGQCWPCWGGMARLVEGTKQGSLTRSHKEMQHGCNE